MPDKRLHRGKHPDDDNLFSRQNIDNLRLAVNDYSMLLSKGYPPKSSLKLVGDHFGLTSRQRIAVLRSSCSRQQFEKRAKKQVSDIHGKAVAIDGYNLLITVEAALAGGYLFIGTDGCIRDLASIHGTYRKVEETLPAIELIAEQLDKQGAVEAAWYLDRPVSNSGRLKVIIQDFARDNDFNWQVKLVNNPDNELIKSDSIVISSDSDVLDKCSFWFNMTERIIEDIPGSTIAILAS